MAAHNIPTLTNVYTTELHGVNNDGHTGRNTGLFGQRIQEGADQVDPGAQMTDSTNPNTGPEKNLRRVLSLVFMIHLTLSTSIVARYLEARVSVNDIVNLWIGTRVKRVAGRLQKEIFGNEAIIRYVGEML
jgi:hypothetical protein